MTIKPPLIDAGALASGLASAAPPIVVDVSFDLTDPEAGERSYREGHLPGAHYLHLDRDLADHSAPSDGRFRGRHPLPAREAFAAVLGRLGVAPASRVVVYDRQGGVYAARAWWMLLWAGHADVAVLDGGLGAWVAWGGTLATEPPTAHAGAPYPLAVPLVQTIQADALQAALGRVRLVDARGAERFRGEVEPLDPVAGHIPGALNRPFKDNLDPATGHFLDAASLRAAFLPLLGGHAPGDVVHACGSGVSACHNLLAMQAGGLGLSRLYPGSWSEWCADPARPVARG